MVEVFNDEQGSATWHLNRSGIVTASAMHKVLAKGEGKTRLSYMYQMIGERITGEPAESFSNSHTERGHEHEPIARNLYQITKEVETVKCGFMRNHKDIGYVGYSPDDTVGDNGLLEIKSKLPHLQAEILDKDQVPREHYHQLQCGLWVAEREWIDFVSYSPFFPLFIKRVERDESYIKNMRSEVISFYADLEEKLQSILNYGN